MRWFPLPGVSAELAHGIRPVAAGYTDEGILPSIREAGESMSTIALAGRRLASVLAALAW
jgi:hypothetical protein